ncbi:DUF3993 domain-containing protein [Priestia flexa]|jgi:Protein of unknown function (DUF3993)|uniref:DUF3993 domain-containing protein n=2 Tax=Priestia TaxID=2800373 RepID=A0A0V8JM28_9BACI|nr:MULTISPECIES: DUF3993 domain-containing protein [Bacillaceae]AQX55374.1 hypothetical protein BC359_14395 [Priestia flexa]KSU88024.1 hypothetical protein AS180_09965 [Priestia veravalensis]KZB91298.1 hypothetical protein A2U94_11515 [Bacillus sp. VT 712]MBN8252491.1 DUF3993 domain-containing protein [Priestia flexa]MBN8433961.1 DUF3993 domain-containing protein [Priestia flexa]
MKKVVASIIIFLCVVCLYTPAQAEVDGDTRNEIFTALHEAFQAQLRLTNEHYSKEKAMNTLLPYFEKSYAEKFLDDNMVQEAQGYTVYGSDFALHYIPYFSYDEQTKVAVHPSMQKAYVFEYFPAVKDGPVSYVGHYEMLTLTRHEGKWKVSGFTYSNQKPS